MPFNSMKPFLWCLLGVLTLTGCATYTVPHEARNLTLVGASSSGVEIHRPRFRVIDGKLAVEAYVLRVFKGETTPASHVDVVYADRQGKAVLIERADVRADRLPRSTRMPRPHAYLLHAMQPLTDGDYRNPGT